MKLVRYLSNGIALNGVVVDNKLYELSDDTVEPASLQTTEIMPMVMSKNEWLSTDEVRLLSPVSSPEKIMCVAVNYRSHAHEQQAKPPEEPYFFAKFRNALIGQDDKILIPRISKKVDWEVELAVVIGIEGKYISRKDAYDHVAGYSVAIDVSFRDLQFPKSWTGSSRYGPNWMKGKALDGAFPLGPWLVTKDEIPDPANLALTLSVNGKMKQKGTTADMVFGIDTLIEYASAGMTLRPGDIISTGTPEGVALFTDQLYLKAGDKIEASIEGIGTLRNYVAEE